MSESQLRKGVRVATRRTGRSGLISSIARHPITRKVTSVVLDPGTGDPEDFFVVSARNLAQLPS
jgi:hypothetical protein